MIKLLIGGSPCTHWSIARTAGRETEPSGIGWELFKNYLIAKEKFKPDFFLYENNQSAARPIREKIAEELGVRLQYINSALVSAQQRKRFYAHNFGDVPLPKDEEIVVLSMYDGIGTGRYCLEKLGYSNIRYYATEIDKHAIEIAKSNYPDIVECGDAFAVREEEWNIKQFRERVKE